MGRGEGEEWEKEEKRVEYNRGVRGRELSITELELQQVVIR
jgi:hypothetical protein